MKHASVFLRVFCLMLAALLCCGILASCGDSEETSSTAPNNTSKEPNENSQSLAGEYTDEDGKYVAKTSGNTYGKTVIKFLTCGVNATYNSELTYNDYANPTPTTNLNEQIPEVINSAYKTRNELVEEQLDIIIEEEYVFDGQRKNAEMCNRIRTDNLAYSGDYHVVVPCLYDGATLAQEGHLINLYDLPGIQMDAPWWEQFFNKEMTIAGQLYFTIGDIGTINKSSTAALTFNKTLYLENNLDSKYGGLPYDLVRDGKWTLDVALEMTKEFSDDVNSDGTIDYEDLVGWSGQLDDMWSLFYGSGSKLASTDTPDGYPVLTAYNERSSVVMEKMQTLVQDKQHYLSANDYFGVVQWPSVLLRDNFIAGQSLFYNGSVSTPMELGDMEDNYGLLPIPKADEAQEAYHSLVNPWTSTCFAVPTSVKDADLQMISDFLNAMGAASANIVSPAYIEQCLEYMKTRDDDTIDMIEHYILPGRGCDIGMIFAWGGLDTMLHDMASAQIGTFSSTYESHASAAQKALDETIGFFKELEGK